MHRMRLSSGWHGCKQLNFLSYDSKICRNVATLSPLANAFNSQKQNFLKNFNLGKHHVGLFGYPELTDHTGFAELQAEAESRTAALLSEATSQTRTRKIVQVFDDLSDTLCKVADMSDFVRITHPNPHYAEAAEQACISTSNLVEQLNTNVDIYTALCDVIKNGDHVPLDDMDRHTADLFAFDFEQSGIHLPENKRKQFVKLTDNTLMLGSEFDRGSQAPVTVHRSQLPENLHMIFGTGDSITVNRCQSDSPNELMREAAYRAYYSINPRQEYILDQLLDHRDQLAKLTGFEAYTHRTCRGSLVQSPDNILDFLHTLADKIRPKAELEYKQMAALKATLGSENKRVMPWDNLYLLTHNKDNADISEFSDYFSLGSCMEGLDLICQSLFGVRLEHQEPEYGESWADDIYKVVVKDEKEGDLGIIYIDAFDRKNKPQRDCHFTIRGGRENADGTYQNPVLVLTLNLSRPRGKVPSLLGPGQVNSLFHEFGHALHSMFGRTRYQHVFGTRCATDFVEAPSQFMEYFARDYRVLSQFAKHWKTGKVLPQEKAEKWIQSCNVHAASDMQTQVVYSLLDQKLHGRHPLGKSTVDILNEVHREYHSQPLVPGTAWHLRFTHLVGYGARYYAYLMSKAVASKVWHQFFINDPLSRSAGEAYRYKMLQHGGGKHPRLLVQDMINEEPTTSSLVNTLLDDLHS